MEDATTDARGVAPGVRGTLPGPPARVYLRDCRMGRGKATGDADVRRSVPDGDNVHLGSRPVRRDANGPEEQRHALRILPMARGVHGRRSTPRQPEGSGAPEETSRIGRG